MTPVDLIRFVLRTAGVNGVGQTPNSEDNNDMLTMFNLMLGRWSQQRFLVYHLKDTGITSTGAASYTVGTGGLFNVPRPDKLASVYYRSLINPALPLDYPLTAIESREDWNAIAAKGVGNWPMSYFYDSGYPLGTLYTWPITGNQPGEIHINTKEVLTAFPDLVTDIALPDEYLDALVWCGSERARIMYGLPPDPAVSGQARAALGVLRASNTQMQTMRMPNAVIGRGRRYNIFNDQGG